MKLLIIWLSLVGALIANIFPLGEHLSLMRPWWTCILVIYWVMQFPQNLGYFSVFLLGIIEDMLLGMPFGQNILVLGLVLFLTLRVRKLVRVFPLWQQSMVVLLIIVIAQLVNFWLSSILYGIPSLLSFSFRCVVSAILWPGLLIFMRRYQRVTYLSEY